MAAKTRDGNQWHGQGLTNDIGARDVGAVQDPHEVFDALLGTILQKGGERDEGEQEWVDNRSKGDKI